MWTALAEVTMRDLVSDKALVAACGLYCGACRAYRKERCPGCRDNGKASWCKVRACCRERGYATCAECETFPDPRSCATFHAPLARVIGFLLRSDRSACVRRIREVGPEAFAREMAAAGRPSLRRGS